MIGAGRLCIFGSQCYLLYFRVILLAVPDVRQVWILGVTCGAQGGFGVPTRGIQALGVGDVTGRTGISDDFILCHSASAPLSG